MQNEKELYNKLATNIAHNLDQYLKRTAMTPAMLADKVELSQAQVSHFRNGRRLPTLPTSKIIADALHITIDDLIKDSDYDTIMNQVKKISKLEEVEKELNRKKHENKELKEQLETAKSKQSMPIYLNDQELDKMDASYASYLRSVLKSI